tara:strand:+ start:300 stop:527 length:228 start_codon:yes stop_codon:yes gene_type:complete
MQIQAEKMKIKVKVVDYFLTNISVFYRAIMNPLLLSLYLMLKPIENSVILRLVYTAYSNAMLTTIVVTGMRRDEG